MSAGIPELPASWLAALAGPYVDFRLAAFAGSVRIASASGPLESVRLTVHDERGDRLTVDRATGQTVAASARFTPSQAREFAAVLLRYADTHRDDR